MPEIVQKNPVNDTHSKPVKTHSRFTPNYSIYQTPQFGLNTPFFAMAGVADDDLSMRLSSDIDTFTLKAPTMTPLKKNNDYFMLPLRCLLPRTAELIITNPLRGDDINAGDANAVLHADSLYQNFTSVLGTNFAAIAQPQTAPTDDASVSSWMLGAIRFFQIYSKLFSKQALVKQLGYSLNHLVYFSKLDTNNVPEYYDLDDVFKVFVSYLTTRLDLQSGNARAITIDWYKVTGRNNSTSPDVTLTTIQKVYGVGVSSYGYHSIAELVYDIFNGDLLCKSVTASFSVFSNGTTFINPFVDSDGHAYLGNAHLGTDNLNLLRLVAYQKACAEFYTVDTVDDVYSANLWEQNMLAIAYMVNSGSNAHIEINGVFVELDACAGIYISKIWYNLQRLILNNYTSYTYMGCWMYLVNLFCYTRSLRYQDYFVGSRVRPLAVGDVTVNVQSNVVDVVDVTRKIQVQRFLNQVNRVGRKFSEYVKGILGDAPMRDAHEPIFLGHVTDTIGAEETQNTADQQYNTDAGITSKYRNNSSRFAFTVHVPEPAIIIGIQNFDIPRVYGSVTDRENYHIDRYDAFNPFMQFVGDQEVKRSELCPGSSGNFGYQQRYAEYKQRVSVASGAFLGHLPGYAKIYDRSYFGDPASTPNIEISSDFIRARESDLDEFYISRDVKDPVSAFNFIIRNDMEVSAKRPMAFAPSIL